MLIRFEGGTVDVLMESFSANALKAHNNVEIHGSLGSLKTDIYGPRLISLYSEKLQDLPGRARVEITVAEGDTFVAEMSHFVDCVAHGQVPTTSGAEERKPLAAVLAAYESMDVGRRITLP
jgi:predicted dehydrogenase